MHSKYIIVYNSVCFLDSGNGKVFCDPGKGHGLRENNPSAGEKNQVEYLLASVTSLYPGLSVGRSGGWLVGWMDCRSVGRSVIIS